MDQELLRKLHTKILYIAEYFDGFCNEHNIVYYLMGGTALGAMRHGGFIPWDDDFDVFMDYENYVKFLSVAEELLNKEEFYLQVEGTSEWPLYFSKIRLNGTTFVEDGLAERDMHHGIYIDVMCLNNCSSNKFFRFTQYLSARAVNARALERRGYTTRSWFKRMVMMFSRLAVCRPVESMLLEYIRKYNRRQTDLIGHFFGRAPFHCTSFPREFLGAQRFVKFDNLSLPVPANVEGYLTVRYGDCYMRMPSEEEKMKYPSHAYIVDVDRSYEEFLRNV